LGGILPDFSLFGIGALLNIRKINMGLCICVCPPHFGYAPKNTIGDSAIILSAPGW
jgi:hypothetical protein